MFYSRWWEDSCRIEAWWNLGWCGLEAWWGWRRMWHHDLKNLGKIRLGVNLGLSEDWRRENVTLWRLRKMCLNCWWLVFCDLRHSSSSVIGLRLLCELFKSISVLVLKNTTTSSCSWIRWVVRFDSSFAAFWFRLEAGLCFHAANVGLHTIVAVQQYLTKLLLLLLDWFRP